MEVMRKSMEQTVSLFEHDDTKQAGSVGEFTRAGKKFLVI